MRPIDGDALRERFEMLACDIWNQDAHTTWATAFFEAADIVEKEITIEAVEVVRCKDCYWWDRSWQLIETKPELRNCKKLRTITREDWFCAEGKRRNE